MTISRPTPRPRRSRCRKGHEYTVENTIVRADGGRRCRECQNACRRGVRRLSKWTVVECSACGDPRRLTDRTARRILAGEAPTVCMACRANPLSEVAVIGAAWMTVEERECPLEWAARVNEQLERRAA